MISPRWLLFLLFVLLTSASSGRGEQPLRRSPHLPETFPWNLTELSEIPQWEWVDSEGPVRSLLYQGIAYQGGPSRVFAYYATPGTLQADRQMDDHLPAIVLVHGGGGTAFREWCELWARQGYAAIAMDLAGHQPIEGKNAHQQQNRRRLPEGGPNQSDEEKFGRVDQPANQQWPYHAVANVIRAHSLIRSFPEVDATRTGVTGISWGGYLTCIVAGIDSRFSAAVPVYGCGFLHENSTWLGRFAAMAPPMRQRWTSLWDPSQYLPAVEMPILFLNGTNDFAYPLDSYMKSYRLVPGEKQLCITVKMPHSHPAGWEPPTIVRFMDQHLRRGKRIPVLHNPVVQKGVVQVEYQAELPITKAQLHWTTDTNAINQREWHSVDAEIEQGACVAPLPPPDATAWFLTITDRQEATVSTEVIFVEPAAD